MLLWFDIVPDHISEVDEWLTRQHFPERVAIPGFLRAQRWVSISSGARYLIVYEVSDIDILSSPPYLDRLNNPTPWTQQVMPHYRGMVRGFCRLERSAGTVLGATCVSVRYAAAPGREAQLQSWLTRDLSPRLERRTGFASVYMLRSDRVPEMTAEQRIRGPDASVESVLLATGHSTDLMKELSATDLSSDAFEEHGASPGTKSDVYQLACIADGGASVSA
jgi:hypothetical protein